MPDGSHFSYIAVIFLEHVKKKKFKSKFSISMYVPHVKKKDLQ